MEGAAPISVDKSTDGLSVALLAVSNVYSKIAFENNVLTLSSASDATQAGQATQVLVSAGLRQLTQLVHNNLTNKVEAVERRALFMIADVLRDVKNSVYPSVYHGAAKSIKAMTFKCPVAMAAVGTTDIGTGLAAALDHCVDLLDYASRQESSRAAGVAGIASADHAGALVALEEVAVCLTYLCGQSEPCKAQAAQAGAVDTTKRAMAILAALSGQGKWPPASAAPVLPALSLPTTIPAQVLPKLAFLLQML